MTEETQKQERPAWNARAVMASKPPGREDTLAAGLPLPTRTRPHSLYEKDFVAWADEQALLLEQQRYDELDLANLVEEVKDLGGRHRDAIKSQVTRLLIHLLKWQFQEEKRSRSWTVSIDNAREQITYLIEDYPVLAVQIEIVLPRCYMRARQKAIKETGLSAAIFPLTCPYGLKDEVLNPDFLPQKDS